MMPGQPSTWVPEFKGQRPPLQPGHEVTLKHGAYSPRRVDPLAKDLVDLMLADPGLGYLTAPAYRPELWAWARAEARVQLLQEYLEDRAGDDTVPDPSDERVRSAELALHRAEARAASGRNRLGLNPLARAKLGKDVALGHAANADVAKVMAELDRMESDGKLPHGWADALGADS